MTSVASLILVLHREKNSRKIALIEASFRPFVSLLEQTGQLLGYWFGGQQVLGGIFPSGDLVSACCCPALTYGFWQRPSSGSLEG